MEPTPVKPPRLAPGDLVGVVAPAGTFERSLLEAGVRKWESLGFRVRLGRSVFERHRYLAGTDDRRLADLNGMLRDPEVAAIVCARGGFGSMRLVPGIDWDAARARARLLIGFSDIAFLLQAWRVQTGQVVIHGPMAANLAFLSEGADRDAWFLRLLQDPAPLPPVEAAGAFREGMAEGPLVGGNLSLLIHTLGTRWEIDTRGAVLLLEDTAEPPYRLDRMLTHLKLAGKLDTVAGIVLGNLGVPFEEVAPALDELLGDAPIPVLHGLPIGHGKDNLPVPLGVRVQVDAGARCLRFLEGAVR